MSGGPQLRARVTTIVLSVFLGLVSLAFGAGVASAAPVPQVSGLTGSMPAVSLAGHLAAAAESNEAVGGVIKGPIGDDGAKVPIPDVAIIVLQDDAEIGSAVTDADGKWTVAVPGPGEYEVRLDVSTLPEGVALRSAEADVVPALNVQPNSTKTAVFPLVAAGEGAAAPSSSSNSSSNLTYFVSMTISGLRYGLIIAMTAIGLSLIFGTTGLINFAHGEMVTIGAVVAFVFGTAPFRWPFIIAVILAVIAVAALGGLIELSLWRPLRKRGTGLIQMFIISIGLALLLRHVVLFFFGSQRDQYVQASIEQKMKFGVIEITPRDLIIIIISVVVLIGVGLMLQHTRMGKAMRALSDNQDLAEASGIDVKRVILNVWLLGGGLAALGGVFLGLTTTVYWQMGWYLLLLMFAGVILGGLGSAFGAILGSIIVGLVAQFSTVWGPAELQNAWAMLVLIAVLLIRPQGLMGRLQRAG